MQFIIGVDIGTSGTKAIAFTIQGQVLFSAYESYSAISLYAGQHELDPALLLEAVVKTLNEVVKNTDAKAGLSGISFSCMLHSLIAVDEKGSPLTNAITWADLRSKAYAAKIRNTAIGKKIYKYTGTPIHPMSPLCKIMWLKENQPEIFTKTYKFISIKEYIWFCFFGKYQVDYGIASATGLFNIYKLKWYDEALMTAGITVDRLSDPVSPVHIERVINKDYQNKLGLTHDISFIIGGNDGCLANLGSNAVKPGEMALTIGTSGAARMTTAKPKHDPKQRIFNYMLTEDLYVSGGAINNGGIAVKWFIENFLGKQSSNAKDFTSFAETADSIAPGSDGLIFLPYLQGERAPVWDPDARAVFFGIHPGHTQQHFMRSVIEGISFSLYQVGLSLEETIGKIEKIYASGGFIQSKIWLQMVADIFNKQVCVTNMADASAIGAAIMGFYALGIIHNLDETNKLISIHQTYYPDEDRHKIYQENFSVFAVLYDKLKDEFVRITNLQEKI